ncbi:MAG: hypothetical protein J0J06_09220 [Sphingomonas sp.]|uniref:hypothetical protein n=1 Tax=Sphingomonas sp. TaxID=28214 RepID=UPI001ACFAA03|nr:hypothetical protein [Sphingomonas sp.]MBN8815613.1 hypothetical protein [Sphingomonas sp.]
MTAPTLRSFAWRAAVIVAAVASVAWFFRFHIASGFTRFSGDSYDGMIEVSILQHWDNVFHGVEPWNRMAYFQPAANSLGYNDGYLLYGLIYSIARTAGLPLVAAAEIVNVTMKLIGFAGMYAFLRRRAEVRRGWALFGAVLFTIADLTLIHVNHAQLLTIALAPIAGYWAWGAIEALDRGDRPGLLRNGLAFVAIFAVWISTAYYTAWFFAFFLLVMLMLRLASGRDARRQVFAAAHHLRGGLAIIGVAALILLAPFLAVYVSKALETGSRGFTGVSRTTLTLPAMVDPGANNAIWSWLLHGGAGQDMVFGVLPILLIVALIAIVRAMRLKTPLTAWRLVALALGVSWLLVLRIGPVTPWYAMHLIPGASALRVIGRFQLVLLVPCIALAARFLDRMKGRWSASLLATALIAEQAAGTDAPVRLDQSQQLAMIATMPAPPPLCRYFVIRSGRPYPYPVQDPKNDAIYAHNVDAMVLAEVYRLPMLNGFSSFNPPGWDFTDPARADFPDRARAYAARYGLGDVCMLDRQHGNIWTQL